jgi:undecaprenyl-diphosphatase
MFDYFLYVKVILLSILEALTEFIPVSSTAHLIIFGKLINFNFSNSAVFEIAIQIGAILAVVVCFWQKIKNILLNFASEKTLVINVIIGVFPALILGFFAYTFIKQYLFNNIVVIAFALIFGGFAIIFIENKIKTKIQQINRLTALKIGLWQCLAMVPGVSRSGASIMGAMLSGVNRATATEFSFFLAIPTIGSACVYDIYKNYHTLSAQDFSLIFFGIVVSFLVSLLVIKWLLKFVSNHSFKIFAYYRIALGLIILGLFYGF